MNLPCIFRLTTAPDRRRNANVLKKFLKLLCTVPKPFIVVEII